MVSERTAVFGAGDITPANMFMQFSKALQAEGITTHFMADKGSKAEEVFTKEDCTLFPEIPNDIDMLIVGCSTSSGFENDLLVEVGHMNNLGTHNITKVVYVDIVGAHRRLGNHSADLYLVSNIVCADELLKDYPDAECVIVGESNAIEVDIPLDVAQSFDNIVLGRGIGPVITWAAQLTTAELELIIECMKLMPGSILVMGLHPDPNKWPNKDEILSLTEELRKEGRAYFTNEVPGLTTDVAGALSDYVAGCYSGSLLKACYNGKRVVCLETPETIASFNNECPGIERYPLVALGVAPLISVPCNLKWLGFPAEETVKSKIVPVCFQEVIETINAL